MTTTTRLLADSTCRVNDAVVAYRKVTKAEIDAHLAELALYAQVSDLNGAEMHRYHRLTAEIDAAVSQVQEDWANATWSRATFRAKVLAALNSAGLDRSCEGRTGSSNETT